MSYILVKVRDAGETEILDLTDLAKEFEKHDKVDRAVIVRNAADRYPSDNYIATYFTTTLALARLNEVVNHDAASA
jgi:hypothetical protein